MYFSQEELYLSDDLMMSFHVRSSCSALMHFVALLPHLLIQDKI